MTQNKYNLGCGRKRLEGYINVDIVDTGATDMLMNLEEFPWPIAGNSVDEVFMDQVLEHMSNVPDILDEIWRILKPGGVAIFRVPYAHSTWQVRDVTHKHSFTEESLDPFCIGCNPVNWYSKRHFIKLVSKRIVESNSFKAKLRNLIPFRNILAYFLNNMYDGVRFELQKPI